MSFLIGQWYDIDKFGLSCEMDGTIFCASRANLLKKKMSTYVNHLRSLLMAKGRIVGIDSSSIVSK